MEKKPKKESNKQLISMQASSAELADLATSGLAAAVANLPQVYDPIKFLIGTGAVFSAGRIVKMGVEVKSFLQSKKAKLLDESETQYRKLFETLRYLHNSSTLDDEFVDALRSLHILSFSQDTQNKELTEIYLLLETAKKLSGGEIITVLAAYRISEGLYSEEKRLKIKSIAEGNTETGHVHLWVRMITEACGYSSGDYVDSQQAHLEELRLIAPRSYDQFQRDGIGGNFHQTGHCRLTGVGYKLGDFIVRGDKLYKQFSKSEA